jgi:hypothetical protein
MAGKLEGTAAVFTGAAHGQGRKECGQDRKECGQGRKKAGGA